MIPRILARVRGASGCLSSGFRLNRPCVYLQYMAHRLEPRNEPMHRRGKVLYSGSMVYGSPQDAAYGTAAEVQHAAHSLFRSRPGSLLLSICASVIISLAFSNHHLHCHHAHCHVSEVAY